MKFDDEIFFTFILPPIIFAAGYNLRSKSFFKYFMYIFVFGVVGTIITFSVVAPLTYIASNNNMFRLSFSQDIIHPENVSNSSHYDNLIIPTNKNNDTVIIPNNINDDYKEEIIYNIEQGQILNFSLKEILMFSAVISATDSVAALTFVKEDTEPKLFALLFGEGVINDAVCIVLYRIVRDFFASETAGIYN